MRRALLAVLVVLAAACGQPSESKPPPGPDPAPTGVRATYRAIAGVSMGAIGSSLLALHNPDRFDAVAPLGGPIDATYLLRYMERFHLGGFCKREELEALLAQNPGNPEILNDPSALKCMKSVPGELKFEHSQNYVNWRFTSNGGTFDRSSYLNLFQDLCLAHGNPLYYNAESPFAPGTTARDASPKGIDPEKLRHPPAEVCTNPLRIKKLFNAEYNPDGKYDAITFCDGEESPIYFCQKSSKVVDFCSGGAKIVPRADEKDFAIKYCGEDLLDEARKDHARDLFLKEKGRYDPCREHTTLMRVAVAFDLNGNGRRDYGEPLVANGHERFDDVGADGCASPLEDGKGGCVSDPQKSPVVTGVKDPNGDDYDALANPDGFDNNWGWDPGEAFRDHGLDGVPGTGDYGEANGKYDMSPNRERMLSLDPRSNYRKLTAEKQKQLDVYLDGGIRDVFNFGLQSREIFGAVRKANGAADALFVRRFAELPGPTAWDDRSYDGFRVKWKDAPRNVLVLYGDENATKDELDNGEGDHVGTPNQALQRFFTMISWVGTRWTGKDPLLPATPSEFSARSKTLTYPSKALGADRDYGIFLPPGYDDEANKDERYPVLFMLHGYGMRAAGPGGFVDSSVFLFDIPMSDRELKLRKMIVVFVSGRCCFKNAKTGQRVCTEDNPATKATWDRAPDYERECNTGNFYADSRGFTGKDGIPYEQSFLELMDHVDQSFRTLGPATVKVR